MNHKVCFYCKTYITAVRNNDGERIFERSNAVAIPAIAPIIGPTPENADEN